MFIVCPSIEQCADSSDSVKSVLEDLDNQRLHFTKNILFT